MFTKKQNLIETMKGGHPDRFVKQYEAFAMVMAGPIAAASPRPAQGGPAVMDAWGVTKRFPANVPGPFPVHDPEHIVCKDITHWRDYVKAPNVIYPAEDWEAAIRQVEAVDRSEQFALTFVAPGVFEQCHYLLEIQNCLVNFYEEPERMHELIDYITEYELAFAEQVCKFLKPDGVFHHDDWGSQRSTFISPEMFEEFFLPAYKKIYGYYKSNGARLIVHHSDSYAATLVPYMIDMGVNIWQGVMTSNDIPSLIQKYGPQITFMGGIDSASVDHPGWTREEVSREVRRACTECGTRYFVPNASQGLAISTFPGVYEAIDEEIDLMSKEVFSALR